MKLWHRFVTWWKTPVTRSKYNLLGGTVCSFCVGWRSARNPAVMLIAIEFAVPVGLMIWFITRLFRKSPQPPEHGVL